MPIGARPDRLISMRMLLQVCELETTLSLPHVTLFPLPHSTALELYQNRRLGTDRHAKSEGKKMNAIRYRNTYARRSNKHSSLTMASCRVFTFLVFLLLLLQSCVRTQGTRIVRLTWVVAIPCVPSLGEFIHKKECIPLTLLTSCFWR